MRIKISYIVILSFLLGPLISNAQEKKPTAPEIGVGITKIKTVRVLNHNYFYSSGPFYLDLSFKVPLKPLHLRSGLILSPFLKYEDYVAFYIGAEKRLTVKKVSFIFALDIAYDYASYKNQAGERYRYLQMVGMGPVLGIMYMPFKRIGIKSEYGFILGRSNSSTAKNDWENGSVHWHRFPSLDIVYILK